jgi:hypothetical protein
MLTRRYLHAAAADGSAGGEGQAPASEAPAPVAPVAAVQDWFLSEGVKGSGKAPDWYDGAKYKSVADQAKAYKDASALLGTQGTKLKELEGKLSTLPKAPEKYAYVLPDAYKESMEIKSDDPSLSKLDGIAKKHNLSQEAFNEIFSVGVDLIANYELTDIAQEKKLIGDNADARIKAVQDWAKANVGEEFAGSLDRLLGVWSRPADVFKVIEGVMLGKRDPALPREQNDSIGNTLADINKKYRTPDPTTKKCLIDTPEGRAQYREELKGVVGDGEHRVVVGKR